MATSAKKVRFAPGIVVVIVLGRARVHPMKYQQMFPSIGCPETADFAMIVSRAEAGWG